MHTVGVLFVHIWTSSFDISTELCKFIWFLYKFVHKVLPQGCTLAEYSSLASAWWEQRIEMTETFAVNFKFYFRSKNFLWIVPRKTNSIGFPDKIPVRTMGDTSVISFVIFKRFTLPFTCFVSTQFIPESEWVDEEKKSWWKNYCSSFFSHFSICLQLYNRIIRSSCMNTRLFWIMFSTDAWSYSIFPSPPEHRKQRWIVCFLNNFGIDFASTVVLCTFREKKWRKRFYLAFYYE